MNEEGVATLAVVTMAVVVAVLLVPIAVDLGLVVRARSQAVAAADGAALAAADAGRAGSTTTARRAATRVALANDARLVTVEAVDGVVTVAVAVEVHTLLLVRVGFHEIRAEATATLVPAAADVRPPHEQEGRGDSEAHGGWFTRSLDGPVCDEPGRDTGTCRCRTPPTGRRASITTSTRT